MSDSAPAVQPAATSERSDDASTPPHACTAFSPLRLMLMIVGFIGAAALASVAIERVHGDSGYFKFPEEIRVLFPPIGEPVPPEVLKLGQRADRVLEYKNTSLSWGLIGAIVTAVIGLIAGRSAMRRIVGLIAGALIGAVAGGAAGACIVFVNARLAAFESLEPLIRTMLMHSGAWACIAAGLGLTVKLAVRNSPPLPRLIGACIAASIVAACIYPVLAAILFASEKSEVLVPTGRANQVFWISLTGIFMAVAIFRVHRHRTLPA